MKYEDAKRELEKRGASIKHFTKRFFQTYKSCLNRARKHDEDGIDDSYQKEGIWLYHCWDEVYNSVFYRENSCGYCAFLEVVYGNV